MPSTSRHPFFAHGFTEGRSGSTGAIRALAKNVVRDVIEIGRHLTEVRELNEGQFLAWIKNEFNWSQRTAYRFIDVYDSFGRSGLPTLASTIRSEERRVGKEFRYRW